MAFQPSDDAAWLSLLRQHMDEMFTCLFKMKEQGLVNHEFTPHIDIFESADMYVIEVDLPGFSNDDFSLSLSASALRIEGVKRIEKNDTTVSYICLERHFGRFSRTIEIPAAFDPASRMTEYERGVLTIRIAKKQEKR
ncbi:MAG: Hsp20/alpha crystallin family protein [Geobacteraceae bacterium]|nr:Hsp20/alpha crystallin family protein [Geobacteraceae bacterium]